jgi:heme-degrading monooxygenase HmoA
MIFEIAEIRIKPGTQAEFEAAVSQAAPLFKRARGCHSMRLERGIETPESYRLVVGWETVEDHMVHFRESDDFQQWRQLAGGFFATAPQVCHVTTVVTGF